MNHLKFRHPNVQRRKAFTICALLLTASLAGCTPSPPPPTVPIVSSNLPSDHVHAMAINPGDAKVYLATHQGLFHYGPGGPEQVGPTIDLMGFSIAGPNHFYASGHPGPDTEMPNPVGLIESVDAGRTWTPLSRQGESDFHLLTTSRGGLIGFDGALKFSATGKTWTPIPGAIINPTSITASSDGTILLVATPQGLWRSTDTGNTWTPIPNAPKVTLLDWVLIDVIAGITTTGEINISFDQGSTWQPRGTVRAGPQAITASMKQNGKLRILIATSTDLLESNDDGYTFTPMPNPPPQTTPSPTG